MHVYNYFEWGFVYATYNPDRLAAAYGFDEEGLWRIQMRIVDPNVPSLYAQNDFRVSIHREEYVSQTEYLAVGQSYTVNLPTLPDLHLEKVSNFGMNANSSQVDVSGALLKYSFHDVYDANVYDSSYWIPYNQRVNVTNVWTKPLSLEIWSSTCFFRQVEYEINEERLEFNIDPTVFDSTYYGRYFSLDIVTSNPLDSASLFVPNETQATDLCRNIVEIIWEEMYDEYYTLEVIHGVYSVSFNPSHAWKVLEDGVYGIWSLTPVRPSLIGDLNGDGSVDIFDVVTLAKAFGSKPGDPNWNQLADLNSDGFVDIFDVVTIAKNFGQTS